MSQGGTRAGRISANAVFGRGLNQRSYRVTAGYIGSQTIVRIRGVERGCLLKAPHCLFKLLASKQLA